MKNNDNEQYLISDGKLHVSVGYMVKLMQKTFIKLKDFLNQNKTVPLHPKEF